ncbi:MAG: hypothetical protein H0V73_05450 [Chloroflexi bacterium]|nr:hypothetical protein [Chloroflexota bacterium]
MASRDAEGTTISGVRGGRFAIGDAAELGAAVGGRTVATLLIVVVVAGLLVGVVWDVAISGPVAVVPRI